MENPDLAVTESAGENLTPEMIPEFAAPKSSSSETLSSLTSPKYSSSETLTTPSPPRHRFVPPLIHRPEDERGWFRLYGMGQRWGLSIESAELVFADSRERSVYGTIYVNNSNRFKVHSVYSRISSEAETVSGGGGHLSLCGPKYFVDTSSATAMYVDLSEVGKASPFINERVLLPFSDIDVDIAPSRSVSVEAVSPGKEATLTIHMTVICPSIPTNISLELSYPDSYNEWLVSGRVTAIQTLNRGKETRSVCLFNRRADDQMRAVKEGDHHVSPGRHKAGITPHRNVFVSPLVFERSYIEKIDELLAEAGHPSSGMAPDNDDYNGVGSYLSIDVDLKFVDSVDEAKWCLVQGALHYQFKCTHEHRAQFRASLKGSILGDKKEPKLPRLSPDIDEDEIEVTLTLVPYAEMAPDMGEELYEKEMSLFTKPDIAPLSSDSSASSAGYSFNDDEQTESKGEESSKPVTDQMESKDE